VSTSGNVLCQLRGYVVSTSGGVLSTSEDVVCQLRGYVV
jgi:hypothetical protein